MITAVILGHGIEVWNGFYTYESKTADFEKNISNLVSLQSRNEVFVCNYNEHLSGGQITRDLTTLSLSVFKRTNIVLRKYESDECNQLPNQMGIYDLNNKSILKFF